TARESPAPYRKGSYAPSWTARWAKAEELPPPRQTARKSSGPGLKSGIVIIWGCLRGEILIQTRNRWGWAPLLGTILVLGLTGCPKSGAGNDVMAKVNGYKVMRAEVDKSLKKQVAGTPQKLTSEQDQVLRLQLLQQIISLQLYLQKAEKLGIVATDEE